MGGRGRKKEGGGRGRGQFSLFEYASLTRLVQQAAARTHKPDKSRLFQISLYCNDDNGRELSDLEAPRCLDLLGGRPLNSENLGWWEGGKKKRISRVLVEF